MSHLSLKQLKQTAGPEFPTTAAVHVQIESIQMKPAKNGNEFLELKLADAEEGTTLRLWSDSPAFAAGRRLAARQFIEASGDWTQGPFGLDARKLELRPLTAEETATLIEGPAPLREKQARDYADITALCDSLADPRLHALCARFLTVHGERFRRTGAAREYHHARRGGLVEHVAQMMRAAAALCTVYTYLNRDLLLTGVLFHDCGKLWENVYAETGFTMPYQEHGEMLGHITLGIELINSLWRQILDDASLSGPWATLQPASDEVRLHLLHLIASHHGELQFGSPVWPKTPEAIALHHVDNIDAKLEMMADTYATSQLLAKNIFERRRPLPANLVRPLPHFDARPPEAPAEP